MLSNQSWLVSNPLRLVVPHLFERAMQVRHKQFVKGTGGSTVRRIHGLNIDVVRSNTFATDPKTFDSTRTQETVNVWSVASPCERVDFGRSSPAHLMMLP